MKRIVQKAGYPYPLGVTAYKEGFNIAINLNAKRECGIILYDENSIPFKIPFQNQFKIGTLYTIFIDEIDISAYRYQFFADGNMVPDPYAKVVCGKEEWGKENWKLTEIFHCVPKYDFSWEEDQALRIPFSDTILYQLHVRGYTKHVSSKVKGKGTFFGLTQKIPYLKELGVTTVQLMPVYEFDEIIKNKSYMEPNKEIEPFMSPEKKEWEYKINYWGFSDAYYFVPKSSYCYTKNPILEFKELVKEFHKQGMELILQMYFDKSVTPGFILEVLRFWVYEYHVDGFMLLGEKLPLALIGTDPLLATTKILAQDIPLDDIFLHPEVQPENKNLAVMKDDFMYDARKYLKSDADMLQNMSQHIRDNKPTVANIHYITNYQGFTLMDLVSYDRKHNEANGEENRDGSDYNYSWNCGCEGKTKKKNVNLLRMKQMKNAFSLLLLAQATPMILGGDEFGFSSLGNNNPYCQDNATTWINWNLMDQKNELYDFVKQLIRIRKEHPILHTKEELRIMDSKSCGYPDISFHGEQAWYPQLENYNRHFAVMFCGKYATLPTGEEDDFFYVAFNMHWVEHGFGLPKLPAGKKWYLLVDTSLTDLLLEEVPISLKKQNELKVLPRTVIVLIGK